MNIKRIVALLMVIMLFSIAAGYVAGLYAYKEYKEKIAYLEKQAQDKFEALEGNLKELYVTFKDTMDENRTETKEVLSKIESVKESIHEWRKGYRDAVSRLRGEIEDLKIDRLKRMVENLQDEIEGFKVTVQDLGLKLDEARGIDTANKTDVINVDLGRISVQKKSTKLKGQKGD